MELSNNTSNQNAKVLFTVKKTPSSPSSANRYYSHLIFQEGEGGLLDNSTPYKSMKYTFRKQDYCPFKARKLPNHLVILNPHSTNIKSSINKETKEEQNEKISPLLIRRLTPNKTPSLEEQNQSLLLIKKRLEIQSQGKTNHQISKSMTSPKGIKFKRRDESLSPIHIDFNTILASPSHIQSFEDNEEYNSRIRAHQNSRIIQFKEQMDKKKIKNSKNKSYLDDNLALHSIEESFHSTINNASWVKNSNCLPVSIYRAFTETSTSENQDNQYQESFLQKKPLGDQNFLPYEKLKYKKNLSMIDPQISSVQLKENLLMGDPQIERIQLKDAIKSLQSPHIFQRFQQQQSYQQQQQQSQELIPSNKISTNTCFNFQNHQTQERSQEHSELSQTQFFQSSGYIPPNQVHLMAKIALSRSRHLHEKEALFKISRGIRNSQLEKVFPQSINRRISSLSTKQKRNSSLNVRKIEINRSLKMNNLHEFPQDSSPSSKYQTNSNKSKQFNQSYFEKESSLSFHDLKPWESKDKCNYQNENISQFGDQYEDNN